MKTLNRPMFRYGGPIKEGVMNGIREPKRNGGSMTQRVQPSNDGSRPGYAGFLAPIAYTAGRALLRPFGKFVARQFAGPVKQGTQKLLTTAANAGKPIKGGFKAERFDPNFVGKAFINDPLAKSVMTGSNFLGKGIQAGGKGIFNVGKYATTTPSGLLFLGLPVTVAAGRYFLSDGTELKGKDLEKIEKRGTSGAPGGGDPGMYLTPEGEQPKELTPAEREALEAEARMKKMDRYKEIMDIKGMNKDAAYKSLTDASKIIQEGGNLKEQLKDGSLIQKITAAASKRFDKVSDTENALRSLIVKGEIDKEMNKEKNQLDNAVKNAQLKAYNKQNEGLSTGEMIQKRLQTAKGEFPQGDELRKIISLNNPELNAKTLPSGDIPTNVDALDYIIGQVAAVNADETTPDYPEGVYIIKDRIIQVLEGQVIPISVNQLK
jgi:hypothetical protein